MDLSNLHNPFDFANPVSDEEIFVGRRQELDEIKYYLDHAKTAPRPINIALLGPRSSGKTSLLNMTELEAQRRGFCAVRIDLDEDDAKTELRFFYKIFDSLLTVACRAGAYEGLNAKTYDTYLDIVNTYGIPEDKTFCPFIFPLQYARALGSGNIDAKISDQNYKADLDKIRKEVKCPIVLLFDEGNILANSRVHLEKLRNIFMNIPGFMLVMTGTPALFPLMDEIFSPIVRQFKKISIAGFTSKKETEECIRNPILKVGIRPTQVFNFNPNSINEIHELSGGRPYEIQLICHMLFRRIQFGEAKRMILTLGVLENVRKQLETSQDITVRPVLTGIHGLEDKQLSALHLLCACDGHMNFDQIWALEYLLKDESLWRKSILYRELESFVRLGIIGIEKGTEDLGFKAPYATEIIKFTGDDFDRIYIKYLARERGIAVNIQQYPSPLQLWLFRVNDVIRQIKGIESINWTDEGIMSDQTIYSIVRRMSPEISDEDMVNEGPSVVEDLYFLMLKYRGKVKIPFVRLSIVLPWLYSHSWYYPENPDDSKSIKDCLHLFEELKVRAQDIGADIKVELVEVPVTPVKVLAQKIKATNNRRWKAMIAMMHIFYMQDEYVDNKNKDEALFHGNLSYKYITKPREGIFNNNLGYLFMANGNLRRARALFNRAIKLCMEPIDKALAIYNLGILHIHNHELKDALVSVEEAVKIARRVHKSRREMGCLFVAKLVNGALKLEEVWHPDLLNIARETKETLSVILH